MRKKVARICRLLSSGTAMSNWEGQPSSKVREAAALWPFQGRTFKDICFSWAQTVEPRPKRNTQLQLFNFTIFPRSKKWPHSEKRYRANSLTQNTLNSLFAFFTRTD